MATHVPVPQTWQEARRQRALELHETGWRPVEIATALGVSRPAVSRWLIRAGDRRHPAWQTQPRSGRPARLAPAQRDLIPDLLSHGAEAHGFRGEVWTCARVATVIEREFGVRYHAHHVARVLRALDWTPQKPVVRAAQRDARAIETWRREVWPDVKKRAEKERRTIVFVDESGFYLLPGRVRTYAPRGAGTTLQPTLTRDHLSVMCGVTPTGDLLTIVREEALHSDDSVLFLVHLFEHVASRLLVLWDGSPIHRGDVAAFLSHTAGRYIHVEPLPPYAPDLNPVEWVWNYLKHVELRNVCCHDLSELRFELALAIKRLRAKHRIVRSFFAGAGLVP
jgi:transposase